MAMKSAHQALLGRVWVGAAGGGETAREPGRSSLESSPFLCRYTIGVGSHYFFPSVPEARSTHGHVSTGVVWGGFVKLCLPTVLRSRDPGPSLCPGSASVFRPVREAG